MAVRARERPVGRVEPPKQLSANPIRRVAEDVVSEFGVRRRGAYPPGPQEFSFGRTLQAARDPLPLLLGLYEEHGPIFSARLLHSPVIFMLGPEANHFITVAHPENFHWRESSFGDLIPLLGDGLLTIDDAYHDRAREIMMPAFHREQVAASVEAMVGEVGSGDRPARAGGGRRHLRVDEEPGDADRDAGAARARPDEAGKGAAAAEHFERALGFYGIDFHLRLLRGPGSPWSKMVRSRAVLDQIVYGEIAQRRAAPTQSRMDILSLLVGVRDEAGEGFSDKEIRDQVMTLMFAGHDTSTSTLTFMMHELARHPDVVEKLWEEQDRVLGDATPDIESSSARCPTSRWSSTRCCGSTRRLGSALAGLWATSSWAATAFPAAPTSTTAPGPATASPRSSPSPRHSSPSVSPASARRRCPAAPTCPSAAGGGSASVSASARPR